MLVTRKYSFFFYLLMIGNVLIMERFESLTVINIIDKLNRSFDFVS